MSQDVPTMQRLKAEVWYLKEIAFGLQGNKQRVKVVTQNFNGPCSFIAICNILILRGNVKILPSEREIVSYEFLAHLVADYMLRRSPDVDISAALSIMPLTQKGMDLNPLFTSSTSFRPLGAGGGELKLFEQAGITLVHGWLVDPASPEAEAVTRVQNYDSAVELIAEVDHITQGRFVENVVASDGPSGSSSSPPSPILSPQERKKIEDAIVVRHFLESTSSQLTYHGLFHLATTLGAGSLVALFRNSHLSVLYKSEGDQPALYALVTDQIFLHEPSVTWERLEDIDGGWSTFVDSDFVRSTPVGGDFAGQTAEDAVRAAEMQAGHNLDGTTELADQEYARQLQAQEDQLAYERERRYREVRQPRIEVGLAQQQGQRPEKKKANCIVM